MSRLLTKLLPKPLKGGLVPSLDLEFARNRYSMRDNGIYQQVPFEKAMTFARNSVGYDIVRGALTQFPVNTPRLTERGMAIYGSRTNLIPTDIPSPTQGTAATTAVSLLTMPERAYVANTLESVSHYLLTTKFDTVVGTTYSFTIYLKRGSYRYVRVWPSQASTFNGLAVAALKIDLQNASVYLKGSGCTNVTTKMLQGGVVEICFSVVATAAASVGLAVAAATPTPDFSELTFAGDGVETQFYYYGGVAEAANASSGLIPAGATRPSELCQVNMKNTALGGWFNPEAGTLIVDVASTDAIGGTTLRRAFELNNGLNTGRLTMGVLNNVGQMAFVAGGVFMRQITGAVTDGRTLLTSRYGLQGLGGKINSQAISGAADRLSDDLKQALVGRSSDSSGLYCLHGTIARIRYYPRWLPDSIINSLHAGS